MVYEGTWNLEDSQYVFNVTGTKVLQDMQAGKLTVLNIEMEGIPYSILLTGGYSGTVDELTVYEFYAESDLLTIINADGVVFAEGTDGNLTLAINK